MRVTRVNSLSDLEQWPPGTLAIEDLNVPSNVILQPQPTDDPNDPLTWSMSIKALNYGLVCFFSLATFTLLCIGPVVYSKVHEELGVSYDNLNDSFAANTAALGVGAVLMIPFAIKYGRRPVYLVSSVVLLASAIRQALVKTTGEIIVVNAFYGFAGSISEVIVQMTVADLFFVHQRGTANGIYLTVVNTGAFLAPVAAGYCATSMGWRWIWWWTVILLGINLVAFIFLYEDIKFVMDASSRAGVSPQPRVSETGSTYSHEAKRVSSSADSRGNVAIAGIPRRKSYSERLALVTKSDTPFFRHFYQPFQVFFMFPAVAFTSLMYGAMLAWFSIVATTMSEYLSSPPYNYDTSQIGLFNLPPFIGAVLGAVVGGPLNDRCILYIAKKHKGQFEPESRLWLALPAILLCPAGLLLYGLSLAHGKAWIMLAVGLGFFGFAFASVCDISLTYLTDCYRDIVGDALVAVAFFRNAVATAIVFALDPWIDAIGLANMFVSASCISVGVLLLILPMLYWGKKARFSSARRYEMMAKLQPSHRPL